MAGQGQTRSGASRILSGDLGMKRVVRRRLFVPCDDAPRAPCPRALMGQSFGRRGQGVAVPRKRALLHMGHAMRLASWKVNKFLLLGTDDRLGLSSYR